MSGSLWIAHGARAAEEVVLAELARHAAALRADPGALARPLRVVVPSRSLREHLAAAALRRAGGALAGVAIQTLRGLAFDLLRRAGDDLREADVLFPAVVRQCAAQAPALREALEPLEDGYGACVASVADLLDAGFTAAHAEACDAALADAPESAASRRARALLQVAARTLERLAALGLAHRSELFRRACERLEAEGAALLPSAGIWIHGYADATGVQTDLLRALVVHAGAQVVIDRPPDPASPDALDSGVRFTQRLAQDLGAPQREATGAAPIPPRLALLRASGAGSEVRGVAERIRGLLDEGVAPERIGIVARELGGYVFPLRVQLRRLGVPFSGAPGVSGPLAPPGRRLHALLDLLRQRDALHCDRWLDAMRGLDRDREADLRVALHAQGAARLRDLARLDVASRLGDADTLPLPVRVGFDAGGEADAPEEPQEREEAEAREEREPEPQGAPQPGAPLRAPRRRLPRSALEQAVERARSLIRSLERAAAAQSLGEHLAALRALCRDELRWREASPAAQALENALASLEERHAGDLRLDFAGFVAVLERALAGAGRTPLGGAGGGVAVLSVTDARARSFEHLFVLGLNRDLFPRAVAEDPLLPDGLRRQLEAALPNVPVKARGFDEERYLFAQLVSSSPDVTLACQAVSDDGKERTPSPLLERVRLSRRVDAGPLLPSVLDGGGDGARLRTAREHAIRAGLRGRGAGFRAALAAALAEGRAAVARPLGERDADELAGARLALLRELERAGDPDEPLGPFLGLVGVRERADPRAEEPSVTVLERLARCPWQVFLERVLHVEPAPDSRSALPSLSPLLIGNLLHAVLERVATDAGVRSGELLDAALAGAPRDVPWPAPERLGELLSAEAERVVHGAGIALPGFARLLVERTAPYLERVRELDWGAGVARDVVGVELEGSLAIALPGGVRRLRFRADRVDRRAPGARLTDYKSGKPLSGAAQETTRHSHLLAAVSRGESLQSIAYALAAPAGSEGRYLFARPDLEHGVFPARGDDAALREAFERAVAVLLGAWDAGSFPPRLVGEDRRSEPQRCEWCAVSAACRRGDSAARQRLRRWLEARESQAPAADASERAALDVFRLAEAKS